MRKLYFDRLTLKGQSSMSNTSIEIDASNNFSLSKSIDVHEKDIQKTDDYDNPLYLKNNYETIVHRDTVGYQETTKVTNTPAMETVQKVNDEKQPLYLEYIYSEDGELTHSIETINMISALGTENEPILIERQKKSPYGKPLYLVPVINEWEEHVVTSTEETIESYQILSWSDEPEVNKPILIPIYKTITVDILSNPEEFMISDVLCEIYSDKMCDYNYSNIIVDMFINEDDIDFTYEEHSANTGAFILTLLPYGKVKLKPVQLESPASKFQLMETINDVDIFINDVKMVDGIVILSRPTSNCTIKFENKSNKLVDIKSYSILY